MTLDIRGSIKNTKLSTNPYVVFEELISNAIDSYLIRKDAEPSAPALDVRVDVVFRTSDLFGELEVMSVRCRDNGCGLGDDQLKAFLTKDTSYKDDLHIAGIGKCKGAGRIQYFHYFGSLSIESTFRRGGEPAQSVVERVLKKYQERVIEETAEIFDLKEEIIRAEPDSEEFRAKINQLAWKYTSSLKNFDMANLSQLVVRRAAIVEILALACGKNLAMQSLADGVRRKDERIIHSIFFPMRRDSTDVTDHDIWLLSEDYQYYDYIASDVPLASIVWEGDETVFEDDIDREFAKLLVERSNDHAAKRPDIALFSKEGSAIIVEFKAPGVSMDDHTGDLREYAHLLAAKSGGKLNRFYCYLIGDTLNPLRLGETWTQFPTGTGWFSSGELRDPVARRQLGETYSEILFYDDVVARAKKRIRVYQDKLQLSLKT
ncbi:MAG: hypothetical protein ACI8Y6_000013 [Brevundimonas sp.]|jgi:hypothetical protein